MPRDVKKHERRLDTLAEVLQCRSACVAVVNINGKILITANEHFNDQQHYELVKEIMSYFQNIALGYTIDPARRDSLLLNIYESKMASKALGDGKLKISKLGITMNFISSLKMLSRHWPTEEECRGLTEENLFVKACCAYAIMKDIYRSFVKIEQGLTKALHRERLGMELSDEDAVAITSEQLRAFKCEPEFLVKPKFKSNQDKLVHAEMQILEQLFIKQVNNPVYVGISKRCCLDCHCMVKATNKVLSSNVKQGEVCLRMNVRDDAHDGQANKWNKPKIFDAPNPSDKLIEEINSCYEQLKSQTPASTDFVQQHSRSSSEGSLGLLEKKAIYLAKQSRNKEVLEELFDESDNSPENTVMRQNMQLLKFSIELCEKNCLEDLFKISPQDQEGSILTASETCFAAIMSYCKQEESYKPLVKHFVKIPSDKNKHFPNIEEPTRSIVLNNLNELVRRLEQQEVAQPAIASLPDKNISQHGKNFLI